MPFIKFETQKLASEKNLRCVRLNSGAEKANNSKSISTLLTLKFTSPSKFEKRAVQKKVSFLNNVKCGT